MKIWILLLCALVAGAGASAQSDESTDLDWDDEWSEYDDAWFKTRLEQLGIYNEEEKEAADDDTNVGSLEKDQDEMDIKVEEEIKQFREDDDDEKTDDYQFEDNRSEPRDNGSDEDKAEPIHDTDEGINQDGGLSASENDYDDYALNVDDNLEANLSDVEDSEIPEPKFAKDDDIVPLKSLESDDEIKRILEEAQAIISEEKNKPNDFVDDNVSQNSEELNKIMEETKAILNEESDKSNDFAEDETDKKDQSKIMEDAIENSDELDQNDDTLQNLSQEEDIPNIDDLINQLDVPDQNDDVDSNDNSVGEDDDTVDKVYKDLNDDLDNLFKTLDKLSSSPDEDEEELKSADVDYAINNDKPLNDKFDYENVFDSNLSDLFAEHSKTEDAEDEVKDTQLSKEIEKTKESIEHIVGQLPYLDDALLSEDKIDEKPVKSVDVEDLSDDQLVRLMKDFEDQHSDVFDIDPLASDHIVNEIVLEYGETKVITSENYPAGYPTNRIVDWVITTSNGMGIELNVTDFAVNSALGDYLMVKPGQVDDSGADGLIFSYHLNEPRAYRFTDVDRIFIRFDSKLGMSFLRGFSLSLKVIAPPPSDPEPEPEPEPLLPEPQHSLVVLLGGITHAQFQDIREQFRMLVADMATMYINANGIDLGVNSTAEITQITTASICNVHWPGFERCVRVEFSVPLVYEDEDDEDRLHEEDLQTMWQTYVDVDPFAARLRQMGIEEFSAPNDGGVLTVWLVVALGVVVSAAMLAFALWRYSCFEDYSRMPAYSETDSLHEKRSSALYPTPHQMLPPLYAEKDYDSTRVDMSGYTNRSYTRTDMYDLDSDEDVVPRDSNAGIQPRDIFSV